MTSIPRLSGILRTLFGAQANQLAHLEFRNARVQIGRQEARQAHLHLHANDAVLHGQGENPGAKCQQHQRQRDEHT